MEGIIKLSKAILIDGVERTELKYDTDLITPELFSEAEALKNKVTTKARTQGGIAGAMELDYSFHMYLGAAAVVAANPTWTFEDVLRIRGIDVRKITGVGRSFMTASDESQEDSSEEPSEITSESLMSQDMNSEKDLSADS
ncbi:MAG: hypothetical protein K5900_12420 [Butyrivibrio sp.]|nr:hypothetical protein [Butyrivibrio sp.]